jgi:putative FmdB family regulatory protein
MPIYEYKCECGVVFETMQTISAKPLKTCQGLGCNGKANSKVQRLMSSTGFVLKGGGWYVTDYPSEGRKKGWEQEQSQSKPAVAAPATGAAGEKPAAPVTPAVAAPASTEPAKPAATRSTPKSPYSSGKKKNASRSGGK